MGLEQKKPETHNRQLSISIGSSRKETKWRARTYTWGQLLEKFKATRRTAETYGEYLQLPKIEQDEIKDVGGFVGGTLKQGRRKKGNVAWRQLLTLDADHVKGDMWAAVEMLFDSAACIYSTHKHSNEKPRLRLVIPLEEPIPAEQYEPIARKVAESLGMGYFDDTTYQAHRLMYWPSTAADAEFVFEVQDGPWLDPKEVLASYEKEGRDWRDPFHWPRSEMETVNRDRQVEKAEDPTTKRGIVGAFCRSFGIQEAIEKYLEDVYTEADTGRYTYAEGSTYGGLVLYDNLYAYSHHESDPASAQLCNVFDLVRIHKFIDRDEKTKRNTPITKRPSYKAMLEFARNIPEVRTELVLSQAAEDFKVEAGENWIALLELDDRGLIKNTLSNMVTILRHDPELQGIRYNEMSGMPDVDGKVPWKRFKRGWAATDDAGLASYLDGIYKIYGINKMRDALLQVSAERSYHPIKEYLDALPEWDETERLDTLLIDYLGADDTEYVQTVTRKTFSAAVARIYRPGVKFDTMLVLVGKQGAGKSTFFDKLAGQFFNDSLHISDMRDKTAAEKLQDYWIIEIGELAGLRKMDEETIKGFMTSRDDRYRAAYGRQVESHPRRCIIVGSTNKASGFLRDVTGNRRFWPVNITAEGDKRPWDMQDIEQIWAEAKMRFKQDESVYLCRRLEEEAWKAQIEALETDDRQGLLEEYLETLLSEDWYSKDIYQRRNFIQGDELQSEGTMQREHVCALEIWCELFGKGKADITRKDSNEITLMLQKIGWRPYPDSKNGKMRVKGYGIQKSYVKGNG